MAGTPSAARPDALAMAPLQDVVAAVRTVMQRLRPDVVVTYDPSGGYGHPDHIVVHRATVAAAAGLIEWSPRVFAAVVPRSWATADRTWVLEHVAARAGVVLPGPGDAFPPSVVEDNPADVVVTGCAEVLRMRDAALREHRTQVSLHDGFYTLSNLVATRLPRREAYRELDQATGGWRAVAPPQVGTPTARGLHDDEEGDPRCS